MNTINVSNPTLNNILMLLNTNGTNPDKPKKRPTFDEVLNKISKRTQNLKSTKQPLNNILTNEQLFRFYIKDTEPLLQKSNDTFNEGNNNLIQSLTASKPSQNTTYGVADIGNTNEPSNIIASRDYVDNPDNITPAPPIAFADMTDEQKLQYAYDGSIEVLKFFNSLNIEANNAVETGTLLNAILMRDAMTDGWRSFGYDLLNDFYRTGVLEIVITELYNIMTRAKAENPNTYEQITDTLYNIMRVDVDGLSKDEIETEIFNYIQNPPAYYGYTRGKSYQGELAKYSASVSRTPSKIVEDMITQMRQRIQSNSTQVPDETPTPELKDPSTFPPRQQELKDPSTFPPRQQELKDPSTFPERTLDDIRRERATKPERTLDDIIRERAINDLFQDEATANEIATDTDPEILNLMNDMVRRVVMDNQAIDTRGVLYPDFTATRVSDLLLPTADYDGLPNHLKPFYQRPQAQSASPRMITPPNTSTAPTIPSILQEDRESVVQPRGRGRPAGSRNRPRRGEPEMRTLLLSEVRRDLIDNPVFQVPDDELEDLINSLFS
jgi:hypothetical protein